MANINSKTVARIAAVQGMYSYSIQRRFGDSSIEPYLDFLIDYYRNFKNTYDVKGNRNDIMGSKIKLNKKYFEDLLFTTVTNLQDIDDLLSSYLSSSWKQEDLHITLLSILRVGICELKFFLEVPHKIILNEYTRIASDLVEEREVGFVNSLLDKVCASINRNQVVNNNGSETST